MCDIAVCSSADVSTPGTDANIDMAIRACREERSQVVQNKERMQVVRESLNDGYCDVSGQGGDMTLAGLSTSIL